MAVTRTVGDAERRARLARRGLLGAPGRPGRRGAAVADALALLHATDPSTVHLALHARSDASQEDVARFLYDDRALLRHTCLRRTVFAMPRDVAPLAHGAYSVDLVAKLRHNLVGWLANAEDPAVADRDDDGRRAWLRDLEDGVVAHLEQHGPCTGNDLAEAVDGLRLRFEPMPGKAYSRPIRCTSKVMEIVAVDGRVARARPTGDLTSSAVTWVAMSDWWPGGLAAPTDGALADPLPPLLERYLATFGPVTTTDAGWWTGLGKTKARRAFATLGAVRVAVHGGDDEAWLLAGDDEPEPELEEHHAALLPGLDSVAMGHKQRGWWLEPDDVDALYDRNGNAGPIAWVGGRAVGAWDQRDDGTVVVGLLRDVGSEAEAELSAEAARTSAWLGDVRVRPRYPVALQKALHAGETTSDITVLGG